MASLRSRRSLPSVNYKLMHNGADIDSESKNSCSSACVYVSPGLYAVDRIIARKETASVSHYL